MDSEKHVDFEAWTRQLDSGARSDPLLHLASRITELAPAYEGPSQGFQERLRTRLLDQFVMLAGRKAAPRRRYLVWGLVALLVLLIAFVGLWRSPGSPPDVSAAEILELAGQHLSERLATADLVYDRWILDWHKGGFREKGVIAELWRSTDGSQIRYQMVDKRGKLLYFDQHDKDVLWRSSYIYLMEGKEVQFVYQAPYLPPTDTLDEKQLLAQLLMSDFGNFWVYIDQMAGYGRSDCSQLFCVLSALGAGWVCDEGHCTLNLGPVLGDDDFFVEAQADNMDWLSNGRQVYQVRLHLAGAPDNYYQILKLDTVTYDLLEIESYSRGALEYSIRLAGRETLAWSDLPEDFFQSIPDGVEVRLWTSDSPLGSYVEDRVWIISADPPPDTSLSGLVTADVEIGYRLTSVDQAAVHLGPLYWVGHDTGEFVGIERVPVSAGEGSIVVSFTFDSDQLGDGEWAMHPCFTDVLGVHPNTCWAGAGPPNGIYLKWCVRCTSDSAVP